jgi:serine/threonine protein kinase
MSGHQERSVKTAESTAPEEFGPYVVYERLGVGGMATVHRAKKRGIAGFERGVALKRMLPHLAEDGEFINSFVREAKLASMLVHPNIAQIYDFGRVGSVYFIAMEHVDGFDVRKMLRYSNRHKEPLPLNVVMSILCELCDALEYAHTFVDEHGTPQGIVHRDVSPSNLIVAQSGHLKVIDFGIAKANVRQLHTESGRVKGKLGYMSPEAVSGRSFGPVSDVFSAGVVAHELLTAHPLFSAKTDYDTLIRIHEAEIPPPSRRNPSVPAALDEVVLAALARDAERRLQTAGAFRQGLEYVAEQAGIRFSARDVAEWRARIATTEDPWGSRTSLPNVSSSAVSRAFPFPDSRNSLSTVSPRPQPPDFARAQTQTAERPARGTGPLDPISEDEKAVADLTWGSEAAPSPLLHPLPEPSMPTLLPPPAAMPAIGSSITRSRLGVARLVLVGLFAVAAVLAVYQFVLRPKKTIAVPPPAIATIKFVVTPADAVVDVGGKEAGRHSPFETQLGPGVYSIRVHKDGFRPYTTEVTLRDGEKPTVQVALEAGAAHLTVSSQPAGLVAMLDGKQLDQVTPFEIQVTTGAHALVVTNAAGIAWTQSFTAEVDGRYSYVAPLTATKRGAVGASSQASAPVASVARPAPAAPERSERQERTPDRGDRNRRPSASPSRVANRDAAESEVRTPDPVVEPVAPPLPPKTETPLPAPAPATTAPKTTPIMPAPAAPKATPVVGPNAVTKLSGDIPAIKVTGVNGASTDVIAKMCIDAGGHVTSVKLVRALPEIADELQRILGGWRYKPYTNPSGEISTACFPVQFRVVFKHTE